MISTTSRWYHSGIPELLYLVVAWDSGISVIEVHDDTHLTLFWTAASLPRLLARYEQASAEALEAERDVREITRRVIKSAISVLEQFNDIRNNRSFAHDNDLIDQAEARFIFDAISAFLRFIKSVETSRFEA